MLLRLFLCPCAWFVLVADSASIDPADPKGRVHIAGSAFVGKRKKRPTGAPRMKVKGRVHKERVEGLRKKLPKKLVCVDTDKVGLPSPCSGACSVDSGAIVGSSPFSEAMAYW
jgi:hypothetical protein